MADVRKRVGLIEYLERRLGSYRDGGGAETEWYCPFCIDREGSESDKRKLYLNVATGKSYCFRCHYGAYDLLRFFRDLNGGTLRYEELAIIRGEIAHPHESVRESVLEVLYGREDDAVDELLPQELPEDIRWLTHCQPGSGITSRAFKYLKRRKIGRRFVETFGIGYCPTGTHSGHLIFPVNQGGVMVYWTTRSIRKNPYQKSKNPINRPGYYSRRQCLFNYDNVVGAEVVAISEGPFDVMAHRVAVGLLGNQISEMQVSLIQSLVRYGTKEFVVSLDAGMGAETDAIYRKLSGRVPKVTVLTLCHGDPHDRRDELPELMRRRGPPSLIDRVRQRLKK